MLKQRKTQIWQTGRSQAVAVTKQEKQEEEGKQEEIRVRNVRLRSMQDGLN